MLFFIKLSIVSVDVIVVIFNAVVNIAIKVVPVDAVHFIGWEGCK